MSAPEALAVLWAEGSRRAVAPGGVAEKWFGAVPRAVVVWGGRVLVIEAVPPDGGPGDNAVVFGAGGAKRVRLRTPPGAGGPYGVIGSPTARLDESGPLVVVATRVADLRGRVDLRAGILVGVRTWR
ncbi:hypothetical protein GCM10010400_26210 [Streptomyces aculeolatus]|uniref:hypothetical protein n=1 Tax=Streptomyces aculeolatus TaxID=270689 RepID=UPI001CEDBC12|nr:hypothetical protein [Streptomyces aculeolatus]